MSSIIHTLARTLPNPGADDPLYDPPYLDLADRVVDIIAAGRIGDLHAFFAELENAYRVEQTPADSNALCEGFMESLIFGLGHAGLAPQQVYRHLNQQSKRVWEDAWQYTNSAPWPANSDASG